MAMDVSGSRTLYIMSDLHLGGVYAQTPEGRGFRMNTHVADVAQFVTSLAQNAASAPVELVINGDMVDFLAEREDTGADWLPFTGDPDQACAKLQAIAERDAVFFEALHTFLEAGNRLVILTGNHDLELALPAVRRKLRQVIGVEPRHDYEFISNGEAYTVGNALIEHGNRYDQWNMVNYDALRHTASLQSRRLPEDGHRFEPPPGSKMVSWVINPIKEDYKFVDLLKPETDAMVPLLLALEPGYRKALATVVILVRQARKQTLATAAMPSVAGDISSDGSMDNISYSDDMGSFDGGAPQPAQNEPEDGLKELLDEKLEGGSGDFLDSLHPNGAEEPATVGDIGSFEEMVDRKLGLAKLFLSRDDADVSRRIPALLQALRALDSDRSFDLDHECAQQYVDAANELMSGGFKYVIFGHTHMAKHIELRPGCWYLNSGTWTDVMQLPQDILNAPNDAQAREKLEPFLLGISSGALVPWIQYRPTYVRLDLDDDDNVVNAELCQYTPAAKAAA